MPDTSSKPDRVSRPVPTEPVAVPAVPVRDKPQVERPAPDPTRYGDWEKNGRCIDF
jgi:hypothetical protein